jgi:hypothetical protein
LEQQVKAAPKRYEVLKGSAEAGQNQRCSAVNVAEDLCQVTQELVVRLTMRLLVVHWEFH